MTIKAAFFDMGGTIQTFTYNRELRLKATPGMQQILHRAGIDLGLTDEELCDVIEGGLGRYHTWRLETLEELPAFRVCQEFIFANISIDPHKLGKVAEELILYYELNYYQRTLRPEIPETLKEIKKLGLKIGLISNVISIAQVPQNLKEYGIAHYFDPVVLSSEYGRRKPDPSIFHYAARLAKVPVSECIYIGDRISRDVLGAKRAGFQMAIQIVHGFQHGEADDGAEPDAVIHSMDELIDIIKKQLGQSRNLKKKTAPIKAIFFDAGDILYYRPNKDQKLFEFLERLGLDAKSASKEELLKVQRDAYEGKITREEYNERMLEIYGVKKPVDIAQGKKIIDSDVDDIQVFDGVPETIRELKSRGFYLGIITDTAQAVSTKLAWFENAGFGDVWDSIISSQEVGLKKPNPDIYCAGLAQLGVRPDESVFVGHMKSELDGATALGMNTVAFNKDADATAKYYVAKFADLLDLPCFDPEKKE